MKQKLSSKKIESICQQAKVSLTPKRRNILTVLMQADQPLSAYDIAEQFQTQFQQPIPAMSVYRMLDVFIGVGLVHKLDSVSGYMMCEHLACEHEHANAQFLICDKCHSVEEISINGPIHDLIMQGAEQAGFELNSLQFELHGTCRACKQSYPQGESSNIGQK